MSERDEKLHQWYTLHAGVVPMTQLVEFGYSERNVYRMVKRNELVILQPGVFQSTQYSTGDLQRQIAACMRNDEVMIARLTAGRTWSFRRLPADRLIHVLVPHGCSPQLRDVVVHRSRTIDPVDIVEFSNGLRVTSPPRTLYDIAGGIGDVATTSIMEQLIYQDGGTLTTHTNTFIRLARTLPESTAVMVRVIASKRKWSGALQTDLEARVLGEILRQGLPHPTAQHTIVVDDGKHRIRFDFAWPDRRVGLEVDHPFWHTGVEQTHGDKWRDRKAGVEGWFTSRVTSLDVDGGLKTAIADVAKILTRAPLVA